MHNHNGDDNNGHKSMMWMMVVCCLLPVVILLGGTAFFKSIGYNWIGIGLVAIFLMIHFGRMRRVRHSHNNEDKKSHDNCCN